MGGVRGGGLLFIYYIARKKAKIVFNWQAVNTLNAVFILAGGLLFISLYSTRFIHYDNFSHWAVVVKYMLTTNHFPDGAAAIIDFKTYPLGSSTFIYYFCKIVGRTDGLMLIGQMVLILACFFAMFSIVWDRRLLLSSVLATCFALMTIFNISIRINNLLVDFLLPLLALSSVAVMFMHRFSFKKMCLFSTPMLALLCITKNSGLFFAAICYGYLLYIAARARKYKGRAKRPTRVLVALSMILLTLVPFIAWQIHTSVEFAGINSKHTMSVSNFEEVSSDKTPAVIEEITDNYINAVFSLDSLGTVGILGANIVALAVWLFVRLVLKLRWRLLYWLIALDVAVVLYYVGIYAMFIFTMPTVEALILAGFERYASSMVIFFIGAVGMCGVVDMEKSLYVQQGARRDHRAFKSRLTKTLYQYATMLFLCLTALLVLSEINGMGSMKMGYPDTLPARVRAVTGDRWDGVDGARYLCYASDTDRQISDYYLQYIARYMLFAPEAEAMSSFEPDTFVNHLREYDYFVIVETDATIEGLMSRYTTAEAAPGIYKVSDLLAGTGAQA